MLSPLTRKNKGFFKASTYFVKELQEKTQPGSPTRTNKTHDKNDDNYENNNNNFFD